MVAPKPDKAKEVAGREALDLLRGKVPKELLNECVGEAFALWPCPVEALVDEALRLARAKRAQASTSRRRSREFLTTDGKVPDQGRRGLDSASKRHEPKRGRKPKVRAGTERLVFPGGGRDLVLHVSSFINDHGEVDVHGKAIGRPRDLAEAVVRVVAGAKLSVLSHREVPNEQLLGVPDPRGPLDGDVIEMPSGVALRRRDGVIEFMGRAEARPSSMRGRIGAMGFTPPAWLSDDLLAELVRVASFESGSRGQLSAKRLTALLRRPHELRRYLKERSEGSRSKKRLARTLPRKPRSRKGKRA